MSSPTALPSNHGSKCWSIGDIQKILLEAQSRWLCPGEICEILRNHQSVGISVEPPNKPPSGSFFLFNREVLRGFRNDGHNWKKNKKGNAMKEGHEKLKVGGKDVLHCYYAHGGENESFKRRSYSMLDQAYKHIVLVHYLEVKGNKTILGHNGVTKEVVPSSLASNSASSRSLANRNALPSPLMPITILNSTQKSEHQAAESDGYKGRQPKNSELNFVSCDQSKEGEPFVPSFSFTQCATKEHIRKQQNVVLGKSLTEKLNIKQEVVHRTSGQDILQVRFFKHMEISNGLKVAYSLPLKLSDAGFWSNSHSEENLTIGNYVSSSSSLKQLLLDNSRTNDLNKVDDSFTRWMSKELGKVDDSHVRTSSVVNWNTVKSEKAAASSSLSSQLHLDSYVFSPSLSQDQLFSIIDFSPNWAYAGSETKVMITGKFLKSLQDVSEECKWSCMFGDVEVPVEVLAHGVFRCRTPPHRDGKVPFYVTCSNRLACSEVREFEFRVSQTRDSDITDLHRGSTNDMLLYIRLGKLLSLGSLFQQKSLSNYVGEKSDISCKISSLMKQGDGEWMQAGDFSQGEVKEQLLKKILKEWMHDWLLLKATEDGKGPCVLDEEGQGVIHLSAALGFDWAIAAITVAGVNINFRDMNGWTALHWSAFYGRERTSVALVSHGASPGALTDPTPEFPLGRTPADLASANGHKGIAGYLAECSLTTHLSFLALKDTRDSDVYATSNSKTSETTSGLVATPLCEGRVADVSLKGSLTACSVAAQAAARIHQALRVQSFQEKMFIDYEDEKFGMLDECALPLTSVRTHKPGQPNVPVHIAAVRIQNKFRGWKGRQEFLNIRQQIIKIQAHVRGHQVRKNYKKILWSVGIMEKVILRWRRKGSGLRGFRLAADIGGTTRIEPSKDDEYDYLKEGRKQTEERLQKALARVKSMVQYPEARDQYCRLLNVVTEFQEAKVMNDRVLNNSEEACDNGDAMTIDFEPFLRDDSFMSAVKSLLEFDDSITSSAAAMIHDHSIPSCSTLTSPKKSSRRFVQKRVVSIPIGDMDGSGLNGEGAPPSDSWAWRKYNQKLIEGSPYLRGYYRCGSSDGCPARKQAERSRVDPSMLVITYAYEHNHPSPASRNFNSTTTAVTTTNNITTSAAPNKLLPKEPSVLWNQPEIQSNEKFVYLGDESLINTNYYGWFSDVASTSSTVLERPICFGSTNELEANIPMISPMGEEDELLFADLWELPECSVPFREFLS